MADTPVATARPPGQGALKGAQMTHRTTGHRAAGSRRTVPTQLAALAAGVSEATIRKWASRGKLSRYGTPGRAEYDLDELMEIVSGGEQFRPGDPEL